MTPGQSEPTAFDRIIASYEWLLSETAAAQNDVHAWNIANFNLEELKHLREMLKRGYRIVP